MSAGRLSGCMNCLHWNNMAKKGDYWVIKWKIWIVSLSGSNLRLCSHASLGPNSRALWLVNWLFFRCPILRHHDLAYLSDIIFSIIFFVGKIAIQNGTGHSPNDNHLIVAVMGYQEKPLFFLFNGPKEPNLHFYRAHHLGLDLFPIRENPREIINLVQVDLADLRLRERTIIWEKKLGKVVGTNHFEKTRRFSGRGQS